MDAALDHRARHEPHGERAGRDRRTGAGSDSVRASRLDSSLPRTPGSAQRHGELERPSRPAQRKELTMNGHTQGGSTFSMYLDELDNDQLVTKISEVGTIDSYVRGIPTEELDRVDRVIGNLSLTGTDLTYWLERESLLKEAIQS